MQMTITNVTNTTKLAGFAINTPDTGLGGVSSDALGGNKLYPLPFPFAHIGALAAGATKTLPMHISDFREKSVPWLPLSPSKEWQMLIQNGIVTVTFATGGDDIEDTAVATVA